MTIKEKTILEDKLTILEEDINLTVKQLSAITDNERCEELLQEYIELTTMRQTLINFVFDCGYWFKRLHDDGWEIDEESFK